MNFAAIVLAAVTLSVETDPPLPAPNLLPEHISNFTTNIVFSKEKKSVYKIVGKQLVKPGRTYVLACEIKPSADVSVSRTARAGLGCVLTYWSQDWKQAVGMSIQECADTGGVFDHSH